MGSGNIFFQGDEKLGQAAKSYFSSSFGVRNNKLLLNTEIHSKVNWRPYINFWASPHLMVIGEVSSEDPYPPILKVTHAEILDVNIPIAIYLICPEEVFLDEKRQGEFRKLQSHGYGLITVDSTGHVNKRFTAIPLIQHISQEQFKEEIKDLPQKARGTLTQTYDTYCQNYVSGFVEITAHVEDLVNLSVRRSINKDYLDSGDINLTVGRVLNKMLTAHPFSPVIPGIAGVRAYIDKYRNTAHHTPQNKRQAYIKYRDCKHGFLEGIKNIISYKESMKKIGISVSL